MTDYFDTADREVRECLVAPNPNGLLTDDLYVSRVAEVEGRVVREVLLCTGDREFPDDLREKILNCIVKRGLVDFAGKLRDPPNADAVDYATTVHSSDLLGSLHSLFHEVARRRIYTRFGPWSDSPSGNLYRRDDHDANPEG